MDRTTEEVGRVRVEAMERLLGRAFPVLDDGFVRVVDYLGGDASIVQAARVSYGKGTRKVSEDRGLIRYLMRHRHTTPFEMCELKLHVRAPMDCWRQWVRHRSASINELSTRYSEAIDARQTTPPEGWRSQSGANRQGSGEPLDVSIGAGLSARESEIQRLAREVYEERLREGVAREQARKDLPLSTYTEAYWKIDLHNLLHFLELRMDDHAQLEIRNYARTIGQEIVQAWCPLTWEAFLDYRVNALTLSAPEIAVLRAICRSDTEAALEAARQAGLLRPSAGTPPWKRSRECQELDEKLERLGLSAPWPAE